MPEIFQLGANGFNVVPQNDVSQLPGTHVIRGARPAARKSSPSREAVDATSRSYLGSRNRTEQV
jgi:hypothetical protein